MAEPLKDLQLTVMFSRVDRGNREMVSHKKQHQRDKRHDQHRATRKITTTAAGKGNLARSGEKTRAQRQGLMR